MRVTLLGAGGQVGAELSAALPRVAEVAAFTRRELDVADRAALGAALARHRPDVIVNAAAYTAVDRAEAEPERARAVNAAAVGWLADYAAEAGAVLVHYSTDYVFDGAKAGPYAEDDAPNPINVYGATKLEGERLAAASGCRHLVFRTSWVIGRTGQNFARTILRLAAERDGLSVVDDQRGAPTSAALIARATVDALAAWSRGDAWPDGTYHLAPRGETSWHGVALELLSLAEGRGLRLKMGAGGVRPIPSADYPTPAARPRNSRLDTAKLAARLSFGLPHWRDDFRAVAGEIVGEARAA